MRIIGGKFKGKKIYFIKNFNTRPLKDSVKESIFNILNHSNEINISIKDSKILDAYSGIGSFGLECISRDAKKVTFIEHNPDAIKILKKNLDTLSISGQAELIQNKLENVDFLDKHKKFNIFFFDPPYMMSNFTESLKFIKNKCIHENDHIVVIHREKKREEILDQHLKQIIEKKYGRSKIIFGMFR